METSQVDGTVYPPPILQTKYGRKLLVQDIKDTLLSTNKNLLQLNTNTNIVC